jgi:Uma2 family endonuclease
MCMPPTTHLTEEQYLEIERKAETKSEYFQGEMFAMSGASLAHIRIVRNTMVALAEQLKSGRCEAFSNDFRVRVGRTRLYTYPDIVATCGEPLLLDKYHDTLLNPRLIIEVLSPSTEAYDRGLKFEHYRTIESLVEYVLVASTRVRVDVFTRDSARWALTSAESLDESVKLESIGCTLSVREIYERVELAPPSVPDDML